MTEEIQKVSEENKLQPKPNEVGLADLLKLAEPLLKMWTDNDNEKHRRELEYETHLLQAISKQNRLATIGGFAIVGLVLIISAVLFFVGRDSTAMDLIQLVVGLGGALLGGYGYAMGKRRLEDSEE
jgi:hypothetical protein